jgi:hypothetical protein
MRKNLSLALAGVMLSAVGLRAQDQAARAQEVLKQARAALGGDAKLAAIQSLSLSGNLRRVVQADAPQVEGEIELDVLLPDKFMKSETTLLPMGGASITMIEGINGDQYFNDRQTSGGGMIMFRRGDDTPQGREVLKQSLRAEFARQLISLLLTSPASFPVEFTYAGEAEAEDGRADVLDVKGPGGFAARLFLEKQTHRPLMLSYQGPAQRLVMRTQQMQAGSREEAEKLAKEAQERAQNQPRPPVELVEVQLHFSDYKSVDGVLLPHHISRSANGQFTEEWEIKKVKINPPLKPEKFQKK